MSPSLGNLATMNVLIYQGLIDNLFLNPTMSQALNRFGGLLYK